MTQLIAEMNLTTSVSSGATGGVSSGVSSGVSLELVLSIGSMCTFLGCTCANLGCAEWCADDMDASVGGCDGVWVPGVEFPE